MPEQFVPYNPDAVAVNGQCPAEPSGPSVPFKVPPLPACPLTTGKNLPPVGSPQWCACLDSLVGWVSAFGDTAFNWLFGRDGENDAEGFWGSVLRQLIPGVRELNATTTLARGLSTKLEEKVNAIYATVKSATQQAGLCNPPAILGVELLRAFISALRNVRLGTDALVWATVDLAFTVSLLDRVLHYVSGYVCPTVIPEWGEIVGCYRRGTAPEGQLRCWAAMRDHDWDVCRPVLDSVRRQPELIESFTLRNREVWDDVDFDKNLRGLGFTDVNERADVKQLRFEVPGPSDLVRFAVRHVFEPDLVSEFGYNDEYRPILDAFHRAQGIDYPIFTDALKDVVTYTELHNGLAPGYFAGLYTQNNLPEPTWARAYWWSHWVLPSPGQGYEMLFRLDPDRDKTGEPAWMQEQSFDLDHLKLLLRAQDYPPYWREKLAAIAYRPPNLRFMRVQIKTKSITHKQAVQDMRAMGFRPDKAEQMVTALEREIQSQENEKLLKLVMAENEAAWETGLVTDAELVNLFLNAGIDEKEANARMQAAVAKRSVELAKMLVKELQKGYLRGRFSWLQASVFLDQVGINEKRKQEYKVLWDAQRQSRMKEATAAQLKKAVVDGALDLASYAQRLRNLDYTDDAIALALSEAKLALAAQQQKTLKAIAQGQLKQERAELQALRATETALKEIRATLARSASPAKLKAFWCEGSIELPEVESRLRALGISEIDIPRWLRECDAKRQKNGLPTYDEAKASGTT